MYNHQMVRYHPCLIWLPVLPLNLTYSLVTAMQLPSMSLAHKDTWLHKFHISSPVSSKQIIPQSGPHRHLTSLTTVWSTQTPDFTSPKSQVQFLVCRSFHSLAHTDTWLHKSQISSPISRMQIIPQNPSCLRPCVIFCNMLVSYGEMVALPSL
jgi:hypothetical protein